MNGRLFLPFENHCSSMHRRPVHTTTVIVIAGEISSILTHPLYFRAILLATLCHVVDSYRATTPV